MASKVTIYNDGGVGRIAILVVPTDPRLSVETHFAEGGENPSPVVLEHVGKDDTIIIREVE